MWIVPKQLISAYAPDMEASSLDCVEQSQLCAQSLFVRSKHSPARTWSQKWKRDSWTQHLSGRILKPSLGKAFEIAWTSSLEVIPASHLAPPESEQDQTTPDIFGPSSQAEFDFFDQGSASSKTSKVISRWDSPQSSVTWKSWVTKQRGAYSQRVKSARLISGSESSSWPTARASDCHNSPTSEQEGNRYAQLRTAVNWPTSTSRDWKGAYSIASHAKNNRMSLLPDAVAHWPTPTVAEAAKIANQANYGQQGLSNHPAIRGEVNRKKLEKGKAGPHAQASSSSHGSRQELWGTPTARDHKSGRGNNEREYKELTPMVERTQTGKLNPRWVETLMGIPIGWTMPSCSQPVTIELTNCDSLETESCQQQQKELFEC